MTDNQREVVAWARELLRLDPWFVDTETTGTDRNAEIVSISIVNQNEEVLFSGYVRPSRQIDETGGAFAVNGISNAMVADAPTFRELWEQKAIRTALNYCTVCAYNAEFDGRMIAQEVRRFTLSPCLDY